MHTLQSRAGLTATLLAGLVLAAVPSATAAITFDAASRAATTSTGRTSLSWSHTVGGGADRMLVVGVAVEDASTTDANITSVTYNGVALTAGAELQAQRRGHAASSRRSSSTCSTRSWAPPAPAPSTSPCRARWTGSPRAPSR